MWLHTHGDLKKEATCRVKPFELVDRTSITPEIVSEERRVMTEYGLRDVDKIKSGVDNDEQNEEIRDSVGA